MLFNKDRMVDWYVVSVLGWSIASLLLYIPFFHFVLGFSIAKIAVFAGVCCAGQLAVMPWLFSARPTAQNPTGGIARRSAAVIVWMTLTALLFFYYLQRDWPSDSHANAFRACAFGTTIFFALVAFVLVGVASRRPRDSQPTNR